MAMWSGLSNAAAVRSNVASSKSHFGEARRQIELRKVVPVFVVTGEAAVRGEIELVPPLELSLRWQRRLAGFLAADQVTTHGDEGLASVGPKRCDDINKAVNVVRPAVQKHDHSTIGGTRFGVSDTQQAGID